MALSVLVVARLRLLLRGCAALLSVVSFRGSPPGGLLFWSSFGLWLVGCFLWLRSVCVRFVGFLRARCFLPCRLFAPSVLGLLMASSVSGSVPVFVPFVPACGVVSLGRAGLAAAVVPVPSSVGSVGGVVAGVAWCSGSPGSWSAVSGGSASVVPPGARALVVRFAGGSSLACLVGAFPAPSDLFSLAVSAGSAVSSGAVVFPRVALSAGSSRPSSGYFCGLAASAPSVAPVVGVFA